MNYMTYEGQDVWKKIQMYLPEHNRIKNDCLPEEKFWSWEGNEIHLDYYPNPSSKVKVILLHGVGGNGRLLSFIGVPLYKSGIEVIAPDLPGYGYSIIKEKSINYNMWIKLINDLIDKELEKDERPIVLFGLSAGGMLGYHAACVNKKISGLIATNFLDQRIQEVRDASARNRIMSRIGIGFINILNYINGSIELPMKLVANMNALTNNKKVLELLIKDCTSSGNKVSIKFIHSLINVQPEIEPENFDSCPVLLAHPEKDRCTDVKVSELFFDKLICHKELRLLENTGHLPIEQPGITQLERYVVEFLDSIG